MARCANCNAPLPDGSQLCAYCGDRNDIDLKGIHYFTTHAVDSPRTCPRCDTRLKSIDLKLNGTFLIERCDQCMGLFFDPGELEALLDATVSNVFLIDRVGLDGINLRRQPDQYPVSYIKCPVCSNLMNRVNFGAKSGVIIDRCKAHGVWLDGGELRHLMEWMKMGGQLLNQERQEQARLEELKRESEQRQKLAAYSSEPSPFDSFGDPLRRSDPDLFDIVFKAVKYFVR
ncbi:MAG: zf-TFIIB domain-containing protein [Deltaproteobacteria bacterium]|nr:zf-TFIIB domain-containing protein [Deltaproteobacteria bacterium]